MKSMIYLGLFKIACNCEFKKFIARGQVQRSAKSKYQWLFGSWQFDSIFFSDSRSTKVDPIFCPLDWYQVVLIKYFYSGFGSSSVDVVFCTLNLDQVVLIHFFLLGFWSSWDDQIIFVLNFDQLDFDPKQGGR